MSVAALALQFLFALLGFLLSFVGLFTFLGGIVLFVALPVVPKLTGEFERFANLPLWLATSTLGRFAIVVTEHDDLLLKSMSFDDLGVETMSFGDETKEFEDPAGALHHWMGLPFALADEKHGVLFDPRHAALGARKQTHDDHGETTIEATQDEYDEWGVMKWKRAVYEFPEKHELVNLSAVRELVDGGERSEYPKRVENIYELSREPFKSGTSATRFIMVLVALLAPFAMFWLFASQSDAGTGAGTTIGFGSSLVVLATVVDWRSCTVSRARWIST